MEEQNLGFVAGIDHSGFDKDAKHIQESVEQVAKKVEQIGMSVDEFAKRMQGVLASFDKLTQAVDKNTAAIDKTGKATGEFGKELKKTGEEGSAVFDKLQKAAAGFFTLAAAKEFGQKVFEVRSEIQSLQTSFDVLVGNKQQAEELFNSIKDFATHTPMQMKDLASAAQTMMSFNIPVEQIMDNLKALGDVSMGDAQKFQSLSLAFSQMSATGKLMGQDLLQMINAGFNPLATISEKTGKSISELKDEMSKGAISADMVRQAFMDATSEGGKFAGMLEKQSQTLGGAYSNLEGAINDMFNAIGEQTEGIMSGAINAATVLVQNYETVGKVILGLVSTYGTYKAAVMTVTAIQGLQTAGVGALTAAETVHYGWLVLCEKAQKLLNATMLNNPFVLVATLIAGVAAALWNMKSMEDLVNEAQDEYNRKKEETIAKEEEHKRKIDELIKVAGDESLSTESRKMAMSELMKKYPSLFKNYDTEIAALKDIAYWKAKIAEIESGKSIQLAQNELLDVNRQINELEAKSRRIKQTTKNVYNHQTLQWEKQTVNVPSLTREEQAKLQQLKNQRSKLNKQMKQDADSNYLKDLTGVSNRDLQKQIKERENLLAQIKVMEQKNGGKKVSGKVQMGGVTGVYSKEDIQDQLTRLKWEQNRRADVIKNGSQNFVSEAQKAYNKEKKELDRLRSLSDPNKRRSSNKTIDVGGKTLKESELTAEELQEAIEKQKKVVEKQQKSLEGLTGKSLKASASAAAKAAKEEQKQVKEAADRSARQVQLDRELAEKEIEARRAAENALAEAAIAGIEDESERERAQEELEHKKRLADIERKGEELKKARYEANKKQWELNNKDKHYETDSEEGRKGWQGVSLSGNELVSLNAELAKENAEYERSARERAQNLIAAHQSYTDRKIALDKQYATEVEKIDKEIAAANARGDEETVKALERTKRQAAADHAKDQSALSLDILKESPEYIRAFEDLESTSSETLEYLIAEFEKAKEAEAKSLNPKDLKEYTDTIKRMKEELDARDPFKALKQSMEELRKSEKNMKEAKERLNLVRQGVKVIKSMRLENGKIVNTYYDEEDAQKEVNEATDDYLEKQKEANDARKKATDTVEELAREISNLGTTIGGTGGEIMGLVGDVISFALQVGNTVTAVTQNMEAVARGASAAIKAVESASVILAVIGAALQILTKVSDMLGLGADYDEYNALVSEYETLTDIWDELIDKKKEYISISYGSEVTKVSKEIIALLEKESEAYRKLGRERLNAGASVGSSSIGKRTRKSMDYDDWTDAARALGLIGEEQEKLIGMWTLADTNWLGLGGRLEGLFDLSAEQLKKLREEALTFWAKLDEDVRKDLEGIIESAERVSEAIKEMKEQVTGVSVDDVFDGVMDSLYDFANGSEDAMDDIAGNWQKMVNKMVVSNLIGNKMREELEAWYDELYQLQDNYNNKRIAEYSYGIDLQRLKDSYNDIVNSGKERIEEFTELGIIKPIEDAASEVKKYFEDLKDSWIETLTDMTATTEDWKNELIDQVLSDLVESTILNAPLTVMVDGAEKQFDDFNKYLEDWTGRYKAIIEDQTLTDEERTSRLKAMIQEQTEVREVQAERSRALAEGIGKDMKEAFSNSLDNLGDTLLDALLDTEKDAESMGREIAGTLIKEMLQTMLASEKYSSEIAKIKEKWQQVLTGKNTDEEGNILFTMDDVLQQVSDLNDTIANDGAIRSLAGQYQELNKQIKNTDSLFGSIKDTFASSMMDMNKTADEMASDIGQTIAKNIIEQMVVSSAVKPLVDNLQKAFDAANVEGATYSSVIGDEAVQNALAELKNAFPELQETAKDIMAGLGVKMNETAKQGFSDLKGTFVNTLTDMDADAETLGKNLGKSMMEQMLNAMVEKEYKDDLKNINDEWADALEAGDPARLEAIKQKAEDLFATIEADQSIKKLADEIKSLTDDTSTSPFDNLRSSFLSALTDMSKSTADFTKDISTMIAQSFVDSFVMGDLFDEKLAKWKKKYKEITTDSSLSEEQRMKQLKGLSELIAGERDAMKDEVSEIYKMLGIREGQDQSATMNMAEAATYDQFELYLGMETSHLMVAEETKGLVAQVLSTLQGMSSLTNPSQNYGEQIFMRLGTTNEYLLAVKKAAEGIRSEFSVKLDRMNAQLAKWG